MIQFESSIKFPAKVFRLQAQYSICCITSPLEIWYRAKELWNKKYMCNIKPSVSFGYGTIVFLFIYLCSIFGKEDCSKITSVASLLPFCMWIAASSWPPKGGVGQRLGTEHRLPKRSMLNLTSMPWGWPLYFLFFNSVIEVYLHTKDCIYLM